MKNVIKIIGICMIILTFGCNNEEKSLCNANIENSQDNYKLNATYKIYHNKNYVTKIQKEEIYKSSDTSVLDFLEESNDLKYSNLKDLYGGYDYEISLKNDTLTIKVTIDMKNVNLDEMVLNGELDNDYVISNKLTTSGIKYYYEKKGATCDM